MARRILAALLLALVGCGTTGGGAKPPPSAAAPAARPAPAAKSRKVVVLLRLQVGDDGAVRNVQVVRSGGSRFDKAATRAASRARFEPPREDGRPIESSVIVTYKFRADRTP